MPHDRDEWISRIRAVELEFKAIRFATDRLLAQAGLDPTILEGRTRLRDIRDAPEHLEGIYVIRLFAEFEKGLRLFWMTTRETDPQMTDLLDAIASRRKRISSHLLANVHTVRKYRNWLIHEHDEEAGQIPIANVQSDLCQFFSFLPPFW